MEKILLMASIVVILTCNIVSFNAIACGGDVDMTVPHIHDENGMFIAIEDAKSKKDVPLKQLNIYQVFAGELALHESSHHPKPAVIEHGEMHSL